MKSKRYFGCKVLQREHPETPPLFMFHARAKDIVQWVGIRRVDEYPDGTQRLLRETRKRAISRFLGSNSINTIPNNILLAFEPGRTNFTPLSASSMECLRNVHMDMTNGCSEQITWGVLNFDYNPAEPEHHRPALIVDGQHRLYGMAEYQTENLPVLVVCILDATVQEQAFQFIVINDKAVKVQTSNVKAIVAHLDESEEELQARLLKAGVRYSNMSPILRDINDLPSSPFQYLLDWPYNKEGNKLVQITAIEQCLRYLRSLFPFLEEDEDSQREIFFAMWNAIKSSYPEVWGQDNKFMTKVNLNALNEYVSERLKFAWEMALFDIFVVDDVEKQVLNILKLIPETFWKTEWRPDFKIQDNANIRKAIKQDLQTLGENARLKKAWYKDLQLVVADDDEFE
jgi:DGQHR domain-containing protein